MKQVFGFVLGVRRISIGSSCQSCANSPWNGYNWVYAIETWDNSKIRAGWKEQTSPTLPLELIAGTLCAQPPGLPPPAPAPAPEEGEQE